MIPCVRNTLTYLISKIKFICYLFLNSLKLYFTFTRTQLQGISSLVPKFIVTDIKLISFITMTVNDTKITGTNGSDTKFNGTQITSTGIFLTINLAIFQYSIFLYGMSYYINNKGNYLLDFARKVFLF